MQWRKLLKLDTELKKRTIEYHTEMAHVNECKKTYHMIRREILTLIGEKEPDMKNIEELEDKARQIDLLLRARPSIRNLSPSEYRGIAEYLIKGSREVV